MLWVRKPLPNTSTPSSRSGAERAAELEELLGDRGAGIETWSTGTSAPGYIATSGT